MASLQSVELTLVLGRYPIAWHLPDLKGLPVTEAVKRTSEGQNGVFVLPHPSPRNNRWLKRNDWFEAQVVPRIRVEIAGLLND